MCGLVNWGKQWKAFFVCEGLQTLRSCNGLLSFFTFPFCQSFLEDECSGLHGDLGYFVLVALSLIFLGSRLASPHILSAPVLQGPICYLT